MKTITPFFPAFVLSLPAKAQFYSSKDYIYFASNRSFTDGRNWAIILNGTHEGDFQIATGNSNNSPIPDVNTTTSLAKLTISNNGNVGIGTTLPQIKLDLGSTQGNGLQFRYDENSNYRLRLTPYWNSGTDTRLDFNIQRDLNLGFTTVMSVGYDNNVGVGITNPLNKITVVDTETGTQQSTKPVAKFINYGNEYSKLVLGSDNTNYDAVISMDNSPTLTNTKLRFYIGNGVLPTAGHNNVR